MENVNLYYMKYVPSIRKLCTSTVFFEDKKYADSSDPKFSITQTKIYTNFFLKADQYKNNTLNIWFQVNKANQHTDQDHPDQG